MFDLSKLPQPARALAALGLCLFVMIGYTVLVRSVWTALQNGGASTGFYVSRLACAAFFTAAVAWLLREHTSSVDEGEA